MDAVRKQTVFLVGCGALGCEYMKGLSLMGACTAPGSKLTVTDMDTIEVSNLSRQFLFRQPDVGEPKSTTAAKVVKAWNPELQVESLTKGVGDTSEDFFTDDFWRSLNICWNALDNVVARKYTDKCCLWHGLPLLESGTLGTKSNSDTFLPGLTQSYNDATESDANETQIAMCTLRSFPYLPLHCIEFAKQAYFSDYMEFAPQQYLSFWKDKAGFFEQLDAMGEAEQYKALRMIKSYIALQQAGPVDFEACVRTAFQHYCDDFIVAIRSLVYVCDKMEATTGKPFWTGTKRRPVEASWDPAKPPAAALEYLYAASNCFAFIWKGSEGAPTEDQPSKKAKKTLQYVRNRAEFQDFVVSLNLQVPAWSPPSEEATVNEGEEEEKVDTAAIETMKGELYAIETSGLQRCEPHDFEKDDDTNFHIDFLTISTNLRSANYNIKLSDRAHVKVTAGRIIPALATTTAMICGIVDVEFLKLAKGLHKEEGAIDKFYAANVNLATGLQAINVFRPNPAIKKKTNLASLTDFTTWDKEEIKGEITVRELVEGLERKYNTVVHRLYPAGNDKIALYDRGDVAKQNWKVAMEGGKLVVEPDAVFAAWPQLRMAAAQLARLPEGGARKNFENQAQSVMRSLQSVKDTFAARFNSKVSQTYVTMVRPGLDSKPEEQQYFDAVMGKRSYLALGVDVKNADGEDADLPLIRYTFR
uniref:Ubiquitin-activating enzyme E1 C-terminal domain-containing protein n=1 Tax=Noctiluca scintillans TaxID=2966 RepID=A0A7S0ZVR3_NOCSC|mmetsp:Transcript_20225/g.53984  ORF Transcript_20225/g.53984 Transcript_20225/m.53984 type:complete len:700 (+) Transcript_20225:96-2195(+)